MLAGGRSRRFGQPKATFKWQEKPLSLHGLDAFPSVCAERLVVVKPDTPLPPLPHDVRLLHDLYEIQHPLSGILTALHHASLEWVFVCAVDMPFLNPSLFQWMAALAEVEAQRGALYEVLVPEVEGRLQPFHALYRQKAYQRLLAIASTGEPLPSLQAVLRGPSMRVLTPDEGRSFFNLNRPMPEQTQRSPQESEEADGFTEKS